MIEDERERQGKLNKLESFGVNIKKPFIQNRCGVIDVENIDARYIADVVKYYKETGWSSVDPWVHILLEQKIGKKNKFFLPIYQYRSLQKVFNEQDRKAAYSDKNFYDIIVRTDRQPKVYVKCVNGRLFDRNNDSKDYSELLCSLESEKKYVIKSSRTGNGKNIFLCSVKDGVLIVNEEKFSLEKLYRRFTKNFLIQEKVIQHPSIAEIHEHSVNTVRMLTFRWGGEVHCLSSFLRVGSNGAVNDNAGTGGLCIGVQENGVLNNYAVSEDCMVHDSHPTTGYSFFKKKSIPNYDEFKSFVKNLHRDIVHHDLVSWDVAIGEDGFPIFLEHNFAGAMWIYQLATGEPIFGELSDDVIRQTPPLVREMRKRAKRGD